MALLFEKPSLRTRMTFEIGVFQLGGLGITQVSSEVGIGKRESVYDIAKNCLSCHTVPNEALVNAGHPTSEKFEFVRWSQGEVRHNFQLDKSTNAESPTLWLDDLHNGPGRTSENLKKERNTLVVYLT